MIRLLVELPAQDATRCGFCTQLSRPSGVCVLFGEPLSAAEGWGFLRAQECLEAEGLAKELEAMK